MQCTVLEELEIFRGDEFADAGLICSLCYDCTAVLLLTSQHVLEENQKTPLARRGLAIST
jgi:hypothetical protein